MDQSVVLVAPARFVLLPVAVAVIGYTVKAMEKKIERGDWAEGREYRKAPDGRIFVDLRGFEHSSSG
jgi:hypothetical protein